MIDETQEIARAHGTRRKPDYFGVDAALGLQYRDRLDSAATGPVVPGTKRGLLEAMRPVPATGRRPREQMPSIGRSIKWRAQ